MNRRELLNALLAAGIAEACHLPALAQAATVPLKDLASEKGVLFGSCLALKYFAQSPAYQQLFIRECDIATPELHMKWNSLSSEPGTYDFGNADRFVSFCKGKRILVRGHTLVWHDSLPAWVSEQISPANGHSIMLKHIEAVAGHFAGQLYSWDVVNEVLDPGSHRPDGLRASTWLANAGPGYIEQAFRATAAADPHALLLWNENYLEVSNGFGDAKRTAMLALLDRLLDRGVPIHGVGLEAHLRGDQANVLADASYEAFLAELGKRKLKIFITELDVQDTTLPKDPAQRDAAVAAIYGKFLVATLRQPAVKGVLTWGLSDAFTWLSGYRPRKDGAAVRPLPFDASCQPKPAYTAIADALRSAPRRA